MKISAVYLIGNPEIPIHYASMSQVEQALLIFDNRSQGYNEVTNSMGLLQGPRLIAWTTKSLIRGNHWVPLEASQREASRPTTTAKAAY